jgi:hypothetical protein
MKQTIPAASAVLNDEKAAVGVQAARVDGAF